MTQLARPSALLLLPFLLLAGCGVSSKITAPTPVSVSAHSGVSGHVHGGQQAIVGAQVYLYAVSATANAGTATSLLRAPGFVLTDLNGNFSITGDYSCPAGAKVYLLALGGNPGLTAATNSKIALAAGLGSCSALSSSSYFTINEVTTVAFAYSLSNYAISETEIGSVSDLSLAFANVTNLVDPVHGTANASSQGDVVPQAKINSLANSLAACINSDGNGSPCSTLLSAANVSSGSGTPADTFQAALNIAQHPTVNVNSIYTVASADQVFAPALTSVPADWNIAAIRTDGCLVADANTYSFDTALGEIYVELRPDVAPKNVANLLSYVNNGSYANSIFHRSLAGFVVQGGGYKFNQSGNLSAIPTQSPVMGEVNLSNVRGTLAMALVGGDPNSATDEFFFNTADNSFLDTQDGGETVLGQVVSVQGPTVCSPQGLAVMDAINVEPTYDLSANFGPAFMDVPLMNYMSGQTLTEANFIILNSVTPLTNVNTTAATPVFTPASGTYTGQQTVSLVDTTPGATIYYTVESPGSTGAGQYVQYTGPITVSQSEIIEAYAAAPGFANASVHNFGEYTIQ